MDPYARGYRDALKELVEYHERQARHYRNARAMELTERRIGLRLHTEEAERLTKKLDDLDRAETPIPMPAPGESP